MMLILKCVARNNNYQQQVSCFSQGANSKLYHPVSMPVSQHVCVQPSCSDNFANVIFGDGLKSRLELGMPNSEVSLLPNSADNYKYFHQSPRERVKLQNWALTLFLFLFSIKQYNCLYYILIICSAFPNANKALQNICSPSLSISRSGKDCCYGQLESTCQWP